MPVAYARQAVLQSIDFDAAELRIYNVVTALRYRLRTDIQASGWSGEANACSERLKLDWASLQKQPGNLDVIFYPNLQFALRVRVLGVSTTASNDFMACSPGHRNLIDAAFLSSLEDGKHRLCNMVEPSPPCTFLCCKVAATVLGMLSDPITVQVGDGVELPLHDVLVVDALPVPLHVAVSVCHKPNLRLTAFPKNISSMLRQDHGGETDHTPQTLACVYVQKRNSEDRACLVA